MLVTLMQILAAALALVGLVALIAGPMSKSDATRNLCLRLVQGGMSLAGVALIITSFLGEGYGSAAGGLLLIVFGTGVTAFGRRSARNETGDKS